MKEVGWEPVVLFDKGILHLLLSVSLEKLPDRNTCDADILKAIKQGKVVEFAFAFPTRKHLC